MRGNDRLWAHLYRLRFQSEYNQYTAEAHKACVLSFAFANENEWK